MQATGLSHFNEVFLNDVRVPATNVVGEVDGGWAVARTVLASESGMIGGAGQASTFDAVVELARASSDAPATRSCANAWPTCTPGRGSSPSSNCACRRRS